MNHSEAMLGMSLLGLHPAHLENLKRLPFDQAQSTLDQIKAEAKSNYRKLALDLHPDRTGGDEDKAERFRIVTEVNRQIQAITLKQRLQKTQPRQRIVIRQVFPVPFVGTVSVAQSRHGGRPFRSTVNMNTSSTPSNHQYDARKVAYIRSNE